MPDGNGDGDGRRTIEEMAEAKAYKGLIVRAGDLLRQDGIITEAMDKMTGKGLGVIPTLITAEEDDKNYRQMLIRARWKNEEQRDKYVKAIAVCRITGAKKGAQTLFDKITADQAGDEGALRREAYTALTQSTFITREEFERKKKHDDSRSKSTSPIA